jgi:hypothetical protein
MMIRDQIQIESVSRQTKKVLQKREKKISCLKTSFLVGWRIFIGLLNVALRG